MTFVTNCCDIFFCRPLPAVPWFPPSSTLLLCNEAGQPRERLLHDGPLCLVEGDDGPPLLASGTKIQPKEEVSGRTSLRTSRQKLRSGPPNPGKPSISERTSHADVHEKISVFFKLRADFSFPIAAQAHHHIHPIFQLLHPYSNFFRIN